MSIYADEAARREAFPVAGNQIFLGHAGVTILPACAARAMSGYVESSSQNHQEFGDVLRDVQDTRLLCAEAIHAAADEIALLGPTSLGLSLFANGLDWNAGDELVCYGDDYPANVYPWTDLRRRGVTVRFVNPERPGMITIDAVEAMLTPRTKLVALASCHYLSGWRIDISGIGKILRERGILFSLDAIQTLGAFDIDASCVDFLSADAHKWMLGPMAIGIVYVAKRNFDVCRPTLLGSWNIQSPEFIAQSDIVFESTARRYEPGVLNIAGIYGMRASLGLLASIGQERVSSSILEVRDELESLLEAQGFEFLSPPRTHPLRSGILTARHPHRSSEHLFDCLQNAKITASLRQDRSGTKWLRFSPHFYNTSEEMHRVSDVLAGR